MTIECLSTNVRTHIGILKNGNSVEFKAVKISGQKKAISVNNTCSFDSVVQAFAAAYCDSERIRNDVDSSSNIPILNLAKYLATKGVNKKAYEMRAAILSSIFTPTEIKTGLLNVDCVCNVFFVIQKTLVNFPSVVEKRQCSSTYCSLRSDLRRLPVLAPDLNRIKQLGISALQSSVIQALARGETLCRRPLDLSDQVPAEAKYFDPDQSKTSVLCKGLLSYTVDVKTHLFVDFSSSSEKLSSSSKNEGEFPLSCVPSFLRVSGKEFHLRSVVAFRSPTGSGIGHYVVYCRRVDGVWEKYDDLSGKVQISSGATVVMPHQILYTI